MIASAAYFTHRASRPNNEDSLFCGGVISGVEAMDAADEWESSNGTSGIFFAVADGMGGYGHGEFASRFLLDFLSSNPPETEDEWRNAIQSAHSELTSKFQSDPNLGVCGTTLAAISVSGRQVLSVNVGDSRIYRVEGPYLCLLSEDGRMSTEGAVPDNPATKPANKLRQAVGGPVRPMLPKAFVRDIPEGSGRYLLCSDGLTDTLSESQIESAVCGVDTSCLAAAESLRARVMEVCSSDNVSFILTDLQPAPST